MYVYAIHRRLDMELEAVRPISVRFDVLVEPASPLYIFSYFFIAVRSQFPLSLVQCDTFTGIILVFGVFIDCFKVVWYAKKVVWYCLSLITFDPAPPFLSTPHGRSDARTHYTSSCLARAAARARPTAHKIMDQYMMSSTSRLD